MNDKVNIISQTPASVAQAEYIYWDVHVFEDE